MWSFIKNTKRQTLLKILLIGILTVLLNTTWNAFVIYKDEGKTVSIKINDVVDDEDRRTFEENKDDDFRMGYTNGTSLLKAGNNSDKLGRWKPKAIIIGVPKCGTGTLLTFLNLHPMIVKTINEETHYFNYGIYKVGIQWYRSQFPRHRQDQIAMEKTPQYFYDIKAAQQIKKFKPDMKLILSLCDPVNRLLSKYAQLRHARRNSPSKRLPFEKVFTMKVNGTIIAKATENNIQWGKYYHWLEKWYEVFPKEQIHIVDGERFKRMPLSEIYSIESFLGLSHKIDEKSLVFNKRRGFYCMIKDKKEVCMGSKKGRKHPVVSRKVRDALEKHFVPFNEKLEDVMGQKLSWM